MTIEFNGRIGRTYRDSESWWPPVANASGNAPNVVVIVLDDVGFSDLGCYGSEIHTPAADGLAAQGLRYNNFNVTAMCSPTRAALLTGRNAHAVGMGIISEWATGFPGYCGRISKGAATAAELLRAHGYSTMAVGKWHLTPSPEVTAAGPMGEWPCGRGFERWYGFHGSLADQWHPDLYVDNHPIEAPSAPGYLLSEDLVDQAMRLVLDQQSAAAHKPFFLYLAFGACHWPHHAPAELIRQYRGRYDEGWDVIRERRWRRQMELGIVPAGTRLAPPNPGVQPWSALTPDMRRLCARQQEVYAAFMEHTDAQIGRLIDRLDRIGAGANTLVILLSDNGASPEGGPFGALNLRKHLRYEPEHPQYVLQGLDKLGSEQALNHYATGWAQVSNTPLKWYKKDTHGGGIRAPLIVRWPAAIPADGIRSQYHHVVDILPTVLEAAGIEAPATYAGIAQLPIDGTSMAYTFAAPQAPGTRHLQLYELLGDRAIYQDGWKAVARHRKGDDFDQDRWELYRLDQDWSECDDRSAAYPDKLRELIEAWWREAGSSGVLPLDDREWERFAERQRIMPEGPRSFVYYPNAARVDRLSVPDVKDRDYMLSAEIHTSRKGESGALLAFGSRFGGYVLHVDDGYLVHEYVYTEAERHVVRSSERIPLGSCRVAYTFRVSANGGGVGTLLIDDRPVGTVQIPKMWPLSGVIGGLLCGRDAGSPVGLGYECPYAFSGTIDRVVMTVGGGPTAATPADFVAERAAD